MALQSELLAMEKQFWSGDAAFYRQHLDDECLTVFTEMAGVQSRDAVADMIGDDRPRWQDVQLDQKGLVEPTADTAILSYEARARRVDGRLYRALVSSAYVRRNGGWKLAFHQQTPLDADA